MSWFNIPVIMQRFYYKEEKKYYISIRPVFYESPQIVDADFNIAKKTFISQWKTIAENATEFSLQKMLFYPDFNVHKVKIDFEFNKNIYHLHLWMLSWKAEGATIWYTHQLDNFLYITPPCDCEFQNDQIIHDCLKKWIRIQKKIWDKETIDQDLSKLSEFSTLTFTEIQVDLSEKEVSFLHSRNSENYRNLLREGLSDCHQTGESVRWNDCQSDLQESFPKKLQDLASRIYNILSKPDKKSILLCGPEFSGRKYLLTHIFKSLDRDFNYENINGNYIRKKSAPQKIAWYFTPGKIIAGMSTVGEWEKRIQSILLAATHFDFILYFDQIVGLLETGQHRNGNLAVTDFLLNAIKNNQIRVVIKATPKQLAILCEKNRSLADQFEIIHMPFLTEKECDSIYINKALTLEEKYSCCFDLSAINLLKQLTKIYESEKSTPGAICSWLTNLALLNKNTWEVRDCFYGNQKSEHLINDEKIISQFQKKTGLSLALFEKKHINSRDSIIQKLTEKIVGQKEAIDRMADLCLRAESLLNDTSRPIGSFLFVGPTGVGKTELARQLARFFFGSEDRLIRFDTNELTTAAAVSALLGDPEHEGTLTGSIRVQPFCVLLFDEIEKAHPSLHDLLLQVLGEARLSDGKGRLVSFSQCIIIMTSNLGAVEAGYQIGFQEKTTDHNEIYRQAAMKFFRPEFLNRIDGIVPFKNLTEKELKIIADQHIENIRKREGIERHNTILHITDKARFWFATQGHDTRWGARKTLRCLENNFVPPIAAFLASLPENDECCLVEATVKNNSFEIIDYPLEEQKRKISLCEFPLENREKDEVCTEINRLKDRLKDWILLLGNLYQINVFKYEITDPRQDDSYFSANNILMHLKSFIDDITPNPDNDDTFHNFNTRRSKWTSYRGEPTEYIHSTKYRHRPYVRREKLVCIDNQFQEEEIITTGKGLVMQSELTANEKEVIIVNYEKFIPFIPLLKYREIPPCDNAVVLYSSTIVPQEFKLPDTLSKSFYFNAENVALNRSFEKMENASVNEETPLDSTSDFDSLPKDKLTVFQWPISDNSIYSELINNNEYTESVQFLYENMLSYFMSNFENDPLLIQGQGFYLSFANGDTAIGFILTGPNVYQRAKYYEGSRVISLTKENENSEDTKIQRQASCYVVLPWSEPLEIKNEFENNKEAPEDAALLNGKRSSQVQDNENDASTEKIKEIYNVSSEILRRSDLNQFSLADAADLVKMIIQWKKEENGKWGPVIPTRPDIPEKDYKDFFGDNVVVKQILF